ncbi:hypothetical protein L1887_10741 [Cichorium endivia]|nr:hypothetical protein L1887_10741 [Cichorium endivia]
MFPIRIPITTSFPFFISLPLYSTPPLSTYFQNATSLFSCTGPASLFCVVFFPNYSLENTENMETKRKGNGITRKCATLVKKQRARIYILRRCATMLLCWYIQGDD